MQQTLDSVLNFLPGWKRIITIVVATALFGAQQAGVEVPGYVLELLALFGFNALAQAPKNQ